MSCKLPYIDKVADLSTEEKEHLSKVHNDIFKNAEESKVFRKKDGKLYAYKDIERFNQAGKYVGKINDAYGKPVAKLVKETLTQSKLAVNTLPLRLPAQQALFNKGAKEPVNPRILKIFQESRVKKASEVLTEITKRPDYVGKLAQKLLDNLHNDVPVRLMTEEEAIDYMDKHEVAVQQGYDITKVDGFYVPKTNEIVVLERAHSGFDNTMNHEVIHALTHYYLHSNEEFAKEFGDLYEKIKSELTEDEKQEFAYELSDIDEFMTGIFTSGEFQSLLATKPSTREEGISVWREIRSWIHNALSNILGLNPEQRTMLDDALEIGTSAIAQSSLAEIEHANDYALNKLTSQQIDTIRADMAKYEAEGITDTAQKFFNLIDKQSSRKDFTAIRDMFKTATADKFEDLKKNLEEVYRKSEKGVKFEQAAIGFGRSIDQLVYLADNIRETIRNTDWASMPDHEVLKQLTTYTQLLNEWQSVSDLLRSDFTGTQSILDIVDKLDGSIKDAKGLINDPKGVLSSPLKSSVLNRLTQLLEPAQGKIQKEYDDTKARLEGVIARKQSRGDDSGAEVVQKLLDKATTEYKRLKVERSDILDFLTGLRGDTNGGSAMLEAFINSPDPITAAVTLDLKQHYDKATELANEYDLSFQKALEPLLKKLGISKFRIFDFNKQLLQEEEHLDGDNTLQLLNPFTGWEKVMETLEDAVDKARVSGDREALRQAKLEKAKFAMDYMYQPYDSEVYKRYELFSDEVGEEAKSERDEIFDDLNDIRIKQSIDGSEGEELSEDEELEIDRLLNQYRQLTSLYNLDGTEKIGREKEKAQKHRDYAEATRKIYEWAPIAGEFQRKRDQYKDDLLTQFKETDPEYIEAMATWDRRNTRIVPNEAFYKERERILNQLNVITKFIKEKLASTTASDYGTAWKNIIEQTKGFRDVDGQPNGTEMEPGKLGAIKDQQEKMEALKKNIEGLSGLTPAENEELSTIWAFIKARVPLTSAQKIRKKELEDKREDLGLSPKDKQAFYDLIQELQMLQARVPTSYYVDQLNDLASVHGKVYDGDTAIDLLTSHELDELRRHPEFEKWFKLNHIQVERWNEDLGMKEDVWQRTYPWSQVVPMDPMHMEQTTLSDGTKIPGVPTYKYFTRQIKDTYKTPQIVGKTVDNRGRWLPRGYNADGDLLAKDDKFINKKYHALKNATDETSKTKMKVLDLYTKRHLETQDKLPTNSGKLWMNVPKVQKQISEMVKDGDLTGALGRAAQKIYHIVPPALRYEKWYNTTAEQDAGETNVKVKRTDILGNMLMDIPVRYTGRMAPGQVSLDVAGAITKYNLSVETKNQLSKTIPFVNSVEAILNSHGFVDPNEVGETATKQYDPETGRYHYIKVQRPVTQKGSYTRLENVRNLQDKYYNGIYKRGIFSDKRGKWDEWADFNIISPLVKIGNISIMAFDYPRAIWNIFASNLYTIFDGISGRNFSVKDFFYAMKDFHTKILPAWIWDSRLELGEKTLYGQLYDLYDSENHLRHLIGSKFAETAAENIGGTMWGVFASPMRMVQSQVGAAVILAMIRNTRVQYNGNPISLLNAYEKGPDGHIKLKDGVEFTEGQFRELKERIRQAIRETQGNYGAQDATKLEQYGAGQLIMFMQRYAVPLFLDGYSTNRFNINNGTTQGYYQTILQQFLKLSNGALREQTNLWPALTDVEKKRVYKGMAMMASSLLFMYMLSYSVKRQPTYKQYSHTNWMRTMGLILAYRTMNETSQMTPWQLGSQMASLAKRPFLAASVLDRLEYVADDLWIEGKVMGHKLTGTPWRVQSGKNYVDPRRVNSGTEKVMYRELYGTNHKLIVDLYKFIGYHGGGIMGQIPGTTASKRLAAARLVTSYKAVMGKNR